MNYNVIDELCQSLNGDSKKFDLWKSVVKGVSAKSGSVSVEKEPQSNNPTQYGFAHAAQSDGNYMGFILSRDYDSGKYTNNPVITFFSTPDGYYTAKRDKDYGMNTRIECSYYDKEAFDTIVDVLKVRSEVTMIMPGDFEKIGISPKELQTYTAEELSEKGGIISAMSEELKKPKTI